MGAWHTEWLHETNDCVRDIQVPRQGRDDGISLGQRSAIHYTASQIAEEHVDLVLEHIHSHDFATAMYALAIWQLQTAKTRAKANELAGVLLPPCRPNTVIPDDEYPGGKPSSWATQETIPDLLDRDESVKVPLFNLSDGSKQSQEEIGNVLQKLMGIKVDYYSSVTNALAKVTLCSLKHYCILTLLNYR